MKCLNCNSRDVEVFIHKDNIFIQCRRCANDEKIYFNDINNKIKSKNFKIEE